MRGRRAAWLKSSGSISLALCIVLPVALLMFNSILLHSRRVRAELDLVRGAVSTGEAALALYDRGLYADFGLFALDGLVLDRALSSLIGPEEGARYSLTPEGPLSDSRVLRAGIARHMTLRAATSLLTDAVDKLRQIKDLGREIPDSSLSALLPPGFDAGYEAVDKPLRFPDQEEPEWFEDYSLAMDDQVRAVYQEGLSYLAPAVLPRDDGSLETLDFDPFNGSGLDKLGQALDKLLYTVPESGLDRLILSEYSLAYFKNDTPFVIRLGSEQEDRTPDGRILASLPASRDQEAEEIATGLEGRNASAVVSLFIGSIRFVLHLIHCLTDSSRMANYRATAAAVAAAIAAISLGEVVIDPEVMTWILLVTATLGKSVHDTAQLKKGYEIDLWPGELGVNVPMRYRDYLRFLIILQPPDTISSRLSNVINRLHPGPYYTEVACLAEWSDVRVTHTASFRSRELEAPAP